MAKQAEPRSIGPYHLLEILGKGGMGTVYLAEDQRNGDRVALKILRDADGSDAERFIREARVAARLHHPHIVRLHDTGIDDGVIYYCMDLIDGVTLDRWFADEQPDHKALADIIEQVARALHYAHERAAIHRDIKPGNILIDADHEPHVFDFGLVRDLSDSDVMTKASSTIGTPSYMAPEQACNDRSKIGPGTDIWAIGVMLYELTTGQLPFSGDTVYGTFKAIVETEAPRPRQLNPDIDPPLEAIISCCLNKDPAHRYRTAVALAEDLNRYRASSRIQANSPGIMRRLLVVRRQHRWIMPMVIGCLLAVVALSAWSLIEDNHQAAGDWLIVEEWQRGEPVVKWQPFVGDLTRRKIDHLEEGFKISEAGISLSSGSRLVTRSPNLTGGVRLTVAMRLPEPAEAIELAIHCPTEPIKNLWKLSAGTVCKLEFQPGKQLIRANLGHTEKPIMGSKLPWRSERPWNRQETTTVAFSSVDGNLLIEVDGRQIMRKQLLLPWVQGDGMMVRTFLPETVIENITIERFSRGKRTSPLAVADVLAREGLWRQAELEYGHLAISHRGRPLGTIAAARQCLAALHNPARDPTAVAALYDAFSQLTTDHDLVTSLNHELIRYYARQAAWDRCLELLGATLQTSRTDSAARLLAADIRQPDGPKPPPEVARTLAAWLLEYNANGYGDISMLGLTELPQIPNRPWDRLDCSWNKLTSLAAVDGVAIKRLDVGWNPALGKVDAIPRDVKQIELWHCSLTSVGQLSAATTLKTLSLSGNKMTDLAPLTKLSLVSLNVSKNQISHLPPMPTLTRLHCSDNPIINLDALSRSRQLEVLSCARTPVTSLAPITGLPIAYIDISATTLTDLGPACQPALRELRINDTPIADLDPLRGLQVEHLYMERTAIKDLSPLTGQSLRVLTAHGSPVSDLRPLDGTDMQTLMVQDCPIDHFGPFLAKPPTRFFPWTRHQPIDFWQDWATQIASERAELATITRQWLTFIDRPTASWRAMAQEIDDQRVGLFIPKMIKGREASQLAAELGAQIPRIQRHGSISLPGMPGMGGAHCRIIPSNDYGRLSQGKGAVSTYSTAGDRLAWMYLIWPIGSGD